MYRHFSVTVDPDLTDINDEEYNTVVDKLNNCFKSKVNVAYERYVFKQAIKF